MLTVLIVDDEIIERNYLSNIFKSHKQQYHVVALAENGEQAVSLAVTHQPDIIIMDISMPLLSGLEAARRIRQQLPNQIIILNSAHAEFTLAHQAVTDQLDAYLLKPAQEDAIFATVQTCLNRKKQGHRKPVAPHYASPQNYPYDLVNHMLITLANGEHKLLRTNLAAFIDFLNGQPPESECYRLYVMNTLFSIEQTLYQSGFSQNVIALLDGDQAMCQISQLDSWEKICSICGEYFSRLLLLIEMNVPATAPGVEAVATYISQHYMDDLTLEALASIVHFSPAYLSRVFHAKMGLTLRTYISQQRIQQAVGMVKHSNKMLRDIAGDCGFKNLSHFHRVFKQQTGTTPLKMRGERR